ncbi:MAG: helicase-related protein [Fimbriimonadaceae bacterium]
MAKLEDLTEGASVKGILPDVAVTVIKSRWIGSSAVDLTYRDPSGRISSELIFRDREPSLEVLAAGLAWGFDADPDLFRLASEARRIQLAHLFDPMLAIHTSLVDPLPHQIVAVYEKMLPRQPLRFLLADDPGAGKTIMAGLLIRELCIRGDVERCLIVCPGALAEQWQDELKSRFNLSFSILTNEGIEASGSGNWFMENPLAIGRLDKLSRDTRLHDKLKEVYFDLIVCDEAHKMSASFFGNEVKYTKRYKLGQLLSGLTRHFLLMTATPHNGKEQDFHLFLALLDGDRFEGRLRDGAHVADIGDLMRRVVKEELLKFDGTPLFPERCAYTVTYSLSGPESNLYEQVTEYVREEFNRVDTWENDRRKGTVGFALTTLQRRLASSPEAIYQSLKRRRERLEARRREEELRQRGRLTAIETACDVLDDEDVDEREEYPDTDTDERESVAGSSAAETIEELNREIEKLKDLETLAGKVRNSGTDRKWEELSRLLQNNAEMFDAHGHRRKLVIFTEHRDTLEYLRRRIETVLGRPDAIVCIHGGMSREDRRNAEEAFTQNKDVEILIATDAAGEGINLQRAHLMVNYDLPWNPNRLEQRFGRIHRIGQTEVCHLWNLVAKETREGEVYEYLLRKIETVREALGGKVFDILGQLRFDDRPLRDLLLEAVRRGDEPEVRERLHRAVENAVNTEALRELLSDHGLAHDVLDVTLVRRVREELERAQARRLQPHFVAQFFREAFAKLGGQMHPRESGRYEITRVPVELQRRDRQIGRGAAVQPRYERVTFDKRFISIPGKPLAAFITPGHPLLSAALDLTLERYSSLLRQGTVLIDDNDPGDQLRLLVYLEHAIQDGHTTPSGDRRVISKRFQFVEFTPDRCPSNAGPAPFLDYRSPTAEEMATLRPVVREAWLDRDIESEAIDYAVEKLVRGHLEEVQRRRTEYVERVRHAVTTRLDAEIKYWDFRANELKEKEQAGKPLANLNSEKARQRADELHVRLKNRLEALDRELQISALPPVVVGAALVVPAGRLARLTGQAAPPTQHAIDTKTVETLAMKAVLDAELRLGFQPRDVSAEKFGWDIESFDPTRGRLRLIEVKGRVAGATEVTVTKNEILAALNKPDDYILAVVEVEGDAAAPRTSVHYVRRPFDREPDFSAVKVVYDLTQLRTRATPPA